jgi:D-galactarolactone cycloisomerase
LRVPLWAGRGAQGKADGLRLLGGGGVATLALHPGWCGGPSEALALRQLAHAHGVNVAFRTSGTLIALAAALHLASTDVRTPGRAESAATLIEWDGIYDPLRDLLFFPGLSIEGGLADAPTTPGWGVAPELESLRRVCASERETNR